MSLASEGTMRKAKVPFHHLKMRIYISHTQESVPQKVPEDETQIKYQ